MHSLFNFLYCNWSRFRHKSKILLGTPIGKSCSLASTSVFFFAELNRKYCELHYRFNPFHATNLFLYPLKISDKQTISDVFKGDRKRPVAWNGLILAFHIKQRHCVKSVRIPSRIQSKSGKYGPEKLRIRTLFTQHAKYGLQNFQNTNTNRLDLTVSFLTPKKWETKLGHFGKIFLLFAMNI